MRILFTFVGGHGHFEPLLPIALAARVAGHTVAFGCGASMVSMVKGAGLTAFGMGGGEGSPPVRARLRPPDREREDRDLHERFVRRAARNRVPRTIGLCAEWKPDVLVCDETDFGTMIAAERLGLPFATVLVTAAGSFVRAEVVGAALGELRAENGMAPDPGLEMPSRYLVLSPFPPSYRDASYPLPATAYSFRPPMVGSVDDSSPAWWVNLPGGPSVYFTLGTIFNMESGDLFERVLTGLRGLPMNLLVTVGHHIDPEVFGLQPPNVHIARFVPQSSVLPHCDLVVSHGGSGSVIGALAHGVPSVLLPMGADQQSNGERCADLGVAQVLDVMKATPESIRAAASMVLSDPTYRSNAERLRDEITALPDLGNAVDLLERLAADKRPLVST